MGVLRAALCHSLIAFVYGSFALQIELLLRDKLIKIGAKVVSNSRYVIFQMAEVAVPRILFREILDRIRQLRFLTIPARPG